MAVETGGLDYKIIVENQFSENLTKFKDQLTAARKEFGLFRDSLAKTAAVRVSTGTENQTRAQEKAARDAAKAARDAARAAKEEQTAIEQIARTSQRVADQKVRDSRRAAAQEMKAADARVQQERSALAEAQKTAIDAERLRRRQTEATVRAFNQQTAAAKKAAKDEQTAIDQIARASERFQARKAAAQIKAAADEQKSITQIARASQKASDSRERLNQQADAETKRAVSERVRVLGEGRKLIEQGNRADAKAAADQQRAIDQIARTSQKAADQKIRAEDQRARIIRAVQAEAAAAEKKGLATGVGGGPPPVIPPAAAKSLKDRILDLLKFKKGLDDTEKSGAKTAFTFGRLLQVAAGFAIIRTFIRVFKDFVRETITLNAQLETATLGIASLIASVAEVRDATGNLASPLDKLTISTGLARKQVQLLRLDALETSSSFEDLLANFQIALGPGLAAGLNVDQIREFTKQISIAATTIGLDQRQLSEEIRSIFAGTIRPQNTRIATALSITNKDIADAKKTGTLVKFLTDRFAVFSAASKQAQGTFTGLVARIKTGFEILLQVGGLQFFERLKLALSGVFDSLVTINQTTKSLELNKDLVKAIEIVGTGLSAAVDEAVRLGQVLGAGAGIQAAQALADILTFASQTLGSFIEGAVTGFSFVIDQVRTFSALFGGLAPTFREIIRAVGILVGAFAAIGLIIGTIGPLAKAFVFIFVGLKQIVTGLIIPFKLLIGTVRLLNTAMIGLGAASSPFLASALAALAAFVGISLVVAQLTGALNLEDTAVGVQGADALLRTQLELKRAFIIATGTAAEIAKIDAQLKELDKTLEINKKSQVPFRKAFSDSGEKILASIKGAMTGVVAEVQKLASPEVTGSILPLSAALTKIHDILQTLKTDLEEATDRLQVQQSTLGLTGDVLGQVHNRIEQQVKANRELKDLELERKGILQRIQELTAEKQRIADQSTGFDVVALEKVNAIITEIAGLEAHIKDLDKGSNELIAARIALAVRENTIIAQTANLEGRREAALLRIQAASGEVLAVARQAGDVNRVALIESQLELATAQASRKTAEEDRAKAIEALRTEIRLAEERLRIAEEVARTTNIGDNVVNPEIAAEQDLIAANLVRLAQLQEMSDLQSQIADQVERETQERIKINQAAVSDPIGAGFAVAVRDSFDEVANLFQQTINIMKSAITGFANFIAESLVSAFDPTNNQTVQERFARFLQQLATQIISTLITLAITAAILNAASGGLLGPLLQGFAQARGFNEGGRAGGFHEGGRAGRPDSHRHARGYADGGSPVERAQHGLIRPSGLHPSDTVPIWAAEDEWVIRGRSVAQAGADAIDRINRGLFDPYSLRAAVGLHGYQSSGRNIRKGRGMGMVDGGAVRSVTSAASAATPNRLGFSVVTSSPDATERLLRGGTPALLQILAENGIRPNA